jgi:hypothetical protein
VSGERHQDLRHHRRQPDRPGRGGKHPELGSHRHHGLARHDHREQRDGEPAAFQEIAERDQGCEPEGVAELHEREHGPDRRRRRVERLRERGLQRLCVVHVGDDHAGREGHRRDRPAQRTCLADRSDRHDSTMRPDGHSSDMLSAT